MKSFSTEQLTTVRASLIGAGVTVQEFCVEHGLSYHVVMAILHGRNAATRGEGHRAAVCLGLKSAHKKRVAKNSQPQRFSA